MKELFSMATKALYVCICMFALICGAQQPVTSSVPLRSADHLAAEFGSAYDEVQNQRMDALQADIALLQKASEKQQSEIEELIRSQSQWSGGLQTLLGLIGFTSVVELGLRLYEKWKKKP